MAARSGGQDATRRAQRNLGLALAAPAIVLVVAFFVFPALSAIYYSFIDFHGAPGAKFVGLDNYARMFADEQMWHALWDNIVWIVVGTIAPLVGGMTLALMMWTVRRGGAFYRTLFFLPYVLPGVVIGIAWSWIYDPLDGWVNRILRALGLGSLARGWLGDPNTALLAILATAACAATGFVMVIMLSALQNVDMEQVEAALLDGAGTVRRLWSVILPQIMPVFLMVLTVTLVGGFAVFDIVFIMTGGGPGNATEVLGTLAYSNAFELNEISYGTTLALLITALSVPCAIFINRLQRKLSLTGTGA